MALLELKDLHTFFRTKKGIVKAVNGVSYSVETGRTLGVVGESGSGKSVSAMSILQLLDGNGYIDSGEILFEGRDLTKLTEKEMYSVRGNDISVIFQEPMTSLNPVFTVSRQVSEPFIIHQGMTKKQAAAKVIEMLADVKIPNPHIVAKQYPHQLSGGQQQRVALARALVAQPGLLLLDEPLSNLDAKLRTSMRTEIIKLHKKLATTFIYVTHDQTEAMTMGDRIVVMKDGIIQQVDTPQNLYDYPCNIFVAGFIGSPQMNFLDGTLKKAGDQFIVDLAGTEVPLPKEKTADGKLDAYVGKTLKVGIRPEDIKDDEEFLEKHPNSHLSAEVEVSELMGAEIYLYLTYQGQNLMARVAPTSKSRRGDKITVAMDTHKIHLFDPETEKTLLN